MREHVIERYLCQRVGERDGIAIKLTSSNNRGVPDRMCLFPGVIVFVEVKAPGKHPFNLQKLWIALLRALGYHCLVIDSRPKVDALITWYDRFCKKERESVKLKLVRKLLKTLRG